MYKKIKDISHCDDTWAIEAHIPIIKLSISQLPQRVFFQIAPCRLAIKSKKPNNCAQTVKKK